MELAEDLRESQTGESLWPSEPIAKAQMRLKMKEFDSLMSAIFGVFMTRGQNQEKIEALKTNLPEHEAFCQSIPKGDRLTMLDVHCFPVWEKMVMWQHSSWGDAFSALEVATLAPSVVQYVEAIRSREELKEVLPRQESFNKLL